MMKKLTTREIDLFYDLIEKITGNHQREDRRNKIFLNNLESYLRQKNVSFIDYLKQVNSQTEEYQKFVSAITNHTTHWFREAIHFDVLKELINKKLAENPRAEIRIWSAACSTGEEVYSIALVLEMIRKQHPNMDYLIIGSDIDSVSLNKAADAKYDLADKQQVPPEYREAGLITEGLSGSECLTVKDEIRRRCQFVLQNLNDETLRPELRNFDFIFCRNVLIYFDSTKVNKVVKYMTRAMNKGSHLFIGTSESFSEPIGGLKALGRSTYELESLPYFETKGAGKTVLIIEDVQSIRIVLRRMLTRNAYGVIEADSAEQADAILATKKVDLISLDLGLPGKDGGTWLKEFRARGARTPVLILSGTSALEAPAVYGALKNGAQDYIEKDLLAQNIDHYIEIVHALTDHRTKIPVSRNQFLPRLKTNDKKLKPQIIAIGASTGGPEALWKIFKNIKKPTPPILLVQHTSSYFAKHFAQMLQEVSQLQVLEHHDGEILKENHIYVAMDSYHISIEENGSNLVFRHQKAAPLENGHRPSVDVLFKSIAKTSAPVLSILLTGMGNDGARGMQAIYQRGSCFNIAQSEESCVIFGMPREAIKLNCVHAISDIEDIRRQIDTFLSSNSTVEIPRLQSKA